MVLFAGGKIREYVSKTFHVGVIFAILLLFPSLRHMGLFSRGGYFREKDKRGNREHYTHAIISTFTVWSLSP